MLLKIVRKIVPERILRIAGMFVTNYRVSKIKKRHRNALNAVSKKEKIRVAFFLISESMWKYNKLYFLLKNDKRFDPVVFICPFNTYGDEIMRDEMCRAYKSFMEKGYTVIKTLKDDDTLVDVKKEFKPDMVFFTNPWNITAPQYLIKNFLEILTCYVPYGFHSSNLFQMHFNMDMQNFCWKVFTETVYHKNLAKMYSSRKGDNFEVTGYPGIDNLLDMIYQSKTVWKSLNKSLKKIIWAPHHTIPGHRKLLSYSTFLTYADAMLKIAEMYQDKIQICFKPHPSLKGKLSNEEIWGKDKTEKYYNKWADLPNGQIAEGDYIDLFLESDAMIHDSSSFLLEYFYTHKPVMFLISSEEVKEQFNDLGNKALKEIDLGYTKDDILQFIENVIIQGKDLRKDKRDMFYNKYLKIPNNKLASENIYNIIVKELEPK